MKVDKRDLASFYERNSAWIVDPGTYTFKVGASSSDIKGSASIRIKEIKTKVHDVLKPVVKLKTLVQK